MIDLYWLYSHPAYFWTILLSCLAWTLFWKGFGLWFAARNRQSGWFVAMLLLNTLGILPIIYLIFFRPAKKELVIGKPPKEKTDSKRVELKNENGSLKSSAKEAKVKKESKNKE